MKKLLISLGLLLLVFAVAEAAPEAPAAVNLQALVDSQFGSQFTLLPGFPALTGDFNGDGIEDIVMVATARGGLHTDSSQYRVIDPTSDYFGIGDPKITSQFASPYQGGPRYLLVIHGSGKDAWHGNPKQKFVLINVSFDRVSIGRVLHKKHAVDDISVEETGVLNAFLYWDGHRYRWQPGSTEL